MARFLVRRLVLVLITLWVVSVLVFSMSRWQGDPRMMFLQKGVGIETWDAWGREFGLDKPLPVQYLVWLGNALRGNLGDSLWERRPVIEAIWQRLPPTILLGLSTLGLTLIGIPLGILSAVKRGSFWDVAGRFLAITGQALPSFWVALMLILVFSVQLGWLPAAKMHGWKSFILPTLTLGGLGSAGFLRLVRSSMLNVLDEEYIKLARSKGASQWAVIWKHAFKNALIPPLTYAGLVLAGIATGTVIVESVFGWPGIGRLAVLASLENDYPLVAGILLLFTFLYIGVNFVVDIVQAYVDPRIRY